jgi:hypothetical protein
MEEPLLEEEGDYSMSGFGKSKGAGIAASVLAPILTIVLFYLLSPQPTGGAVLPGQGLVFDMLNGSLKNPLFAFLICAVLLVLGGAGIPQIIRLF